MRCSVMFQQVLLYCCLVKEWSGFRYGNSNLVSNLASFQFKFFFRLICCFLRYIDYVTRIAVLPWSFLYLLVVNGYLSISRLPMKVFKIFSRYCNKLFFINGIIIACQICSEFCFLGMIILVLITALSLFLCFAVEYVYEKIGDPKVFLHYGSTIVNSVTSAAFLSA